MASFKAKFPVLQELFAKNHRGGPFGPSPVPLLYSQMNSISAKPIIINGILTFIVITDLLLDDSIISWNV